MTTYTNNCFKQLDIKSGVFEKPGNFIEVKIMNTYCDSCIDAAEEEAFGIDGSLILSSMSEFLPDHLCMAEDGEIECACNSHG